MRYQSALLRDSTFVRNFSVKKLVGGLGFEPRLAESESAVLPLDDPPAVAGTWAGPARRARQLVAQCFSFWSP